MNDEEMLEVDKHNELLKQFSKEEQLKIIDLIKHFEKEYDCISSTIKIPYVFNWDEIPRKFKSLVFKRFLEHKTFVLSDIVDTDGYYVSNCNHNDEDIYYEGEFYRKSNYRAGYDIIQHEDIEIPPKQITKIKTNVRFPEGIGNNFALVTLRSSYQNSGLSMPAIGILDSDYTDYLFMTIFNLSNYPFKIHKGDRLVQLVFIKNNDIALIKNK